MAIKVQESASEMKRAGAGGSVPLPRVLRMFWVGSLVAFALIVVLSYIEYRMGYKQPHYNPLGGDRYQDLMEFFGDRGYSLVAYPPFGAVIYGVIYGTGQPVVFYLTTAALWLAAGVLGVRRELIARGIEGVTATLFPLTLLLVSFPIAGLLQRGNVELYAWIFAGVGTWVFLRGCDNWAAALWGLAAAMKLHPIVLLMLLLPRKKYRAIMLGMATFVGATLLSLKWLGPTVSMAWHGVLRIVFGYQGLRASQWNLHELMANHTAYDLAKFGALLTGVPLAKLTLPYYVCGGLALSVAFFGNLWRKPVANQLLGLTAFMVEFPPVSYYYTLVHLYAAWLVLAFVAIRAAKARVEVRGLKLTMLLFLPLFGSYMLLSFPRVYLYGGLLQAALLGMLFLCALEYPFAVEGATPGLGVCAEVKDGEMI